MHCLLLTAVLLGGCFFVAAHAVEQLKITDAGDVAIPEMAERNNDMTRDTAMEESDIQLREANPKAIRYGPRRPRKYAPVHSSHRYQAPKTSQSYRPSFRRRPSSGHRGTVFGKGRQQTRTRNVLHLPPQQRRVKRVSRPRVQSPYRPRPQQSNRLPPQMGFSRMWPPQINFHQRPRPPFMGQQPFEMPRGPPPRPAMVPQSFSVGRGMSMPRFGMPQRFPGGGRGGLPKSCGDVKKMSPGGFAPSKAYKLLMGHQTGMVYCYMETMGNCGEGPWTSLMKVDGNKRTFRFTSRHWTSQSTFSTRKGARREGSGEFKLGTFQSMPINQVCLVFMGHGSRHHVLLTLNDPAQSLLSLTASGDFTPVEVGREYWLRALPQAKLQPFCNKEGFNVKARLANHARARIGIIGNNEDDDCFSCDSYIGIGTGGNGCGCPKRTCEGISAGNVNFCHKHRRAARVLILGQ